jgi:hypothetical protein
MRYTPEADTDMWVVTSFEPNLNGKLELPDLGVLETNVAVEGDYNYFSSHWHDYDVRVLGDGQ